MSTFTDANIWNDYECTPFSDEWLQRYKNGLVGKNDITQSSRANFDKALHQTQIEPPASGLRNLAAWLAVLVVAGAIGAALVARRGR